MLTADRIGDGDLKVRMSVVIDPSGDVQLQIRGRLQAPSQNSPTSMAVTLLTLRVHLRVQRYFFRCFSAFKR